MFRGLGFRGTPKVRNVMAFWVIFEGFGRLSDRFWGSRYGGGVTYAGSSQGSIGGHGL